MDGHERNRTPEKDEIEVSLFGPGYGECVVLHIGGGNWCVVDSCIDNATKGPVALNYFQCLNIDVTKSVKTVFISHWHDDHTRGISKVVAECADAKVICSAALQNKEFLQLVYLAGRQRTMKMDSTGLSEFFQIVNLLKLESESRYSSLVWATADRAIVRQEFEDTQTDCIITALSPSDTAIERARLEFNNLIPEDGKPKCRIPSSNKNNTSVVLWVQLGNDIILLGSDLENTTEKTDGWQAILDLSVSPSGNADVYKVPHHGSITGHNSDVWQKMVCENPIAILTPFFHGKHVLPTAEDVLRITSTTTHAYITSKPSRPKTKKRDPSVERTLREMGCKLRKNQSQMGHIRLRKRLGSSDDWHVETFGAAHSLK